MESLRSDSFTTESCKSSALKHITPPVHWNNSIPSPFTAGLWANADLIVWGICQWGRQLCWVYTEERRRCAGSASLHPPPAYRCEGSCGAKHKAHPLQEDLFALFCSKWWISECSRADRGFGYNDFIISNINYMLQQKISFTHISFLLIKNGVDQPKCVLHPVSDSLVLNSSYEANAANISQFHPKIISLNICLKSHPDLQWWCTDSLNSVM